MKLSLLLSLLIAFIFLQSPMSEAGFLLTPKGEIVSGREVLARRGSLKAKADAKSKRWGVLFEGFAEYDAADSITRRRSPAKGYLNEAYVEYQRGSFFLKAGKQSLRWSEMWIVPSLDVWTSRRYNRLYWDSFSDQMEHSTGVSATIAGEIWSWDFALMPLVSADQFPEPIPEYTIKNPPTSFGVRFKFTPEQIGIALIGAQKDYETWIGVQPSLAFDSFVMKGEWGLVNHSEKDLLAPDREKNFISVGADIFLDQLTITPQATVSRVNELGGGTDTTESLMYLGLAWLKGKHDVQAQVFTASLLKEGFASFSYGYSWTDHLVLTGFVQSYDGQVGSLHRIYKELVGGTTVGARIEVPFGM